jgi:hypothetical protein
MKKLEFRESCFENVKRQLRCATLTLSAFGVLVSCGPNRVETNKPLITIDQRNERPKEKPKPVKGTWKHGECWLEGNVLVFTYVSGETIDRKEHKTTLKLESGESIREMKCNEEGSFALTDRSFLLFPGADKLYLGKSELNLDHGRINIGDLAKRVIDWLPRKNEAFFLTQDSMEFHAYDGRPNRRVSGEFDKNCTMAFYRDVLFVSIPGKKNYLLTFKPSDGTANEYGADPWPDGKASFVEEKDCLILNIGDRKLKIKIEKEEIEMTWAR